MTATQTKMTEKQQQLLKKLGLAAEKKLGSNFVSLEEGDSIAVVIKSAVEEFHSKKTGETYKYIEVDNLETGETDLKMWVSGQLNYLLGELKDGFIGGKFMITNAGKIEAQVEVDGKMKTCQINQFEVFPLA